MQNSNSLPIGHPAVKPTVVRSSIELGTLVRDQRRHLALRQLDIAGMGNTGNRFIIDLEGGKPTLQLQKVLEIVDLLGLELIIRPKASSGA